MANNALTLSEYTWVNNQLTGQIALNADKANRAVNLGQITPAEYEQLVNKITGRYVSPQIHPDGRGPTIYTFSDTPTYTSTNAVNSNDATVSRGKVTRPISSTINGTTGKVEQSLLRGVGSKTLTAISKVAAPVAAAQAACFLGKTIDTIAYNANPDFWDSIGLSTVNPDTWGSFIYSDPNAPEYINGFLQMITGIDPDTGESQAYMNADTLAYMAYCMQLAGIFDVGAEYSYIDAATAQSEFNVNEQINIYSTILNDGDILHVVRGVNPNVYFDYKIHGTIQAVIDPTNTLFFITQDSTAYTEYSSQGGSYSTYPRFTSYTIKGVNYRYSGQALGLAQNDVLTPAVTRNTTNYSGYYWRDVAAYVLFRGTREQSGGIEGIGTQSGATTPQFDGLSESDILPALQQQYPDAFDNAITWPNVQSDGTVADLTYVPVPWVTASSPLDNQPVTGEYTQAQPAIDPATASPDVLQYLTDFLQDILPTQQPPANPTDTGEGSTPVPVAPTGQASSLWKIYHPSQAQVDQFGAWLWSPSFVDQIAKIFNNPMESIIGLHKVYATPIDAGISTIHVGYLDSGVSSAYIEQQYIDVDCGTVDLYEQFGNVLDYTGTTVKLYLPFIGIVSLDVAEVMRSTIGISYGVDVLTGACLARVTISRDGNDAIMYQYAGNCAVQYPVSSGSYMGIVSSIIGVAGSVAAAVASGGSVAPLAIGAAGAAFGAHTTVQNSGSFSGNAGAMGGKIPYLIIERTQSALADDFSSFEGYPANQNCTLGECTGFVRANVAHLTGLNATETELDELTALLNSGVIV